MRLKPGKLYRVCFHKYLIPGYIKRAGLRTDRATYGRNPNNKLKEGELLLFVERREPQLRTIRQKAHTPYVFLRGNEIVVYEKLHDYTLYEIFEEIKTK